MAGYQSLQLLGNVGSDPELKYLQDGTPLVEFSVAVNEGQDRTTWFRVTAWGSTDPKKNSQVDFVSARVKQGDLVFVSGRVSLSTWVSDGQAKGKLEVRANQVLKLSSAGDGDEQTDG